MEKILNNLAQMVDIATTLKQRDDLYFITVKEQQLELVLSHLKDYHNFSHLAFLQAVDYIEDNNFMLTYMLYNYMLKINLGVNVFITRENANMISIHKLWKHAWQYQRELNELYGIYFPDSPRVEESFVLEGWEDIPPMRRDFDTAEYCEKTFYPREGRETNDPTIHMKKKRYNNFVDSPKIRRNNG